MRKSMLPLSLLLIVAVSACLANDELEPIPAPSDVAFAPADAIRTGSGLAYKVLKEGNSTFPTARNRVKVHYTGWTTNGVMFDSSISRGEPATFGVTEVIVGWTEGLQLMGEGSQYRLWIPEPLAYNGSPNRPAGLLVFDISLLEVL